MFASSEILECDGNHLLVVNEGGMVLLEQDSGVGEKPRLAAEAEIGAAVESWA